MSTFPSLWKSDRNDPFRALQREMDRVFNQFAQDDWLTTTLPAQRLALSPPCDIEETDAAYVMSMDLPGLSKNDVKIELKDGILRVSGERKEERLSGYAKKGNSRTERYFGSFERMVSLPGDIRPEQVEAHFENGVLRIAVPKSEAAKTQQIPIHEGKSGFFAKWLGKKETQPSAPGVTPAAATAGKEKVA
jgi:HSP20 family protein